VVAWTEEELAKLPAMKEKAFENGVIARLKLKIKTN